MKQISKHYTYTVLATGFCAVACAVESLLLTDYGYEALPIKTLNFQIKNKMNKENKTSDKHEHGNDFIADVSGSVTYQGVTYNWGDKVVSPNGYEFFVVTYDGRWGLVDHGGTFCELQHCDLTGYLHCH